MSLHIAHIIPFASRIGGYERQGRLLATTQHAISGIRTSICTHKSDAKLLDPALALPVYGIAHRRSAFDRRAIAAMLQDVDVIHAHALAPLCGAIVHAGREMGIPAIVKVATQHDVTAFANPESYAHEIPPNLTSRSGVCSRFRSKRWVRLQTRALQDAWDHLSQAELFIALNGTIEAELIAAGVSASNIIKLPNAVQMPSQSAAFRPHGMKALYVGRIAKRKRLDVLLAAFSIVSTQFSEATLDIVGDGDAEICEQIMLIKDGIQYHGPTNDPTAFYKKVDIFVFPSEREGCPNALLEAASNSIAPVVTAIPGISDWFTHEHDSLHATAGDVEEFAHNWIKLLKDSTLRQTIADNARNTVTKIASLDFMIDTYMDLYHTLVNRSHNTTDGTSG